MSKSSLNPPKEDLDARRLPARAELNFGRIRRRGRFILGVPSPRCADRIKRADLERTNRDTSLILGSTRSWQPAEA